MGKELAWGIDHACGLFVQVFDLLSQDEKLLVNLDQGPYSVEDGYFLTRNKLLEVFEQYGFEQAKKDYLEYERQELEEPLIGYLHDYNDNYEIRETIRSYRDLHEMIERAVIEKKKLIITDFLDRLVLQIN